MIASAAGTNGPVRRRFGGRTPALGARPVHLPIFVALALGVLFIFVTLVGFMITSRAEFLLVAAAGIPTLMLVAPQLFQRSFDLLAPLNFLALSVFFGTTLRTLYVVVIENRITRELLLQQQPPEFLLPAILLINASLVCLVVGYLVNWPRIPLEKATLFQVHGWSKPRVRLVVMILVAIGSASVVLYMHRLDLRIADLADLSAKRRLEVEGADYAYAALGYYLWGMSLLSYAFFLLWAQLAFSRRRVLSLLGLCVFAVGVLAAVPPLLTSSRTGLLVLLVYAALIWNYARGPLTGRWLAGAVVAGLLIVTAMGGLRSLGRNTDPALDLGPTAIPEAVLGNRNWLGVTKTAHLMAAVPTELEYQRGRSLVTWMVAPIPRTVWPDKPVIRVGITVGEEVFDKDSRRSGVPPGFIGELYLNFGFFGVFAGMLVLGIVLRTLYISFWPLLHTSPSAVLLYSVIIFPLSFTLVTTDVSGSVIEIFRSLITLAVLLPLVSCAGGRSTAPPADSRRAGSRRTGEP